MSNVKVTKDLDGKGKETGRTKVKVWDIFNWYFRDEPDWADLGDKIAYHTGADFKQSMELVEEAKAAWAELGSEDKKADKEPLKEPDKEPKLGDATADETLDLD